MIHWLDCVSRIPSAKHYRIEQMKHLAALLFTLAVVAVAFGVARILEYVRARDMRSLALRLGFQYVGRPLPDSFQMSCYPPDEIRVVSNVIESKRSGMRVLIFDSVIGERKGYCCTFIAVQTDRNPFGSDDPREKTIQSCGWTALYRTRFLQTPGTLSVQRIEEHLSLLRT